jgi:hypothetical protein
MKILAIITCLLFAPLAKAETIIIPVQDLLIEIPNFKAPTYGFNAGLNGQYTVTDIPKTKRDRKAQEKKLINMVYDIYPDAESVRIWNGTFIIKLPGN